MEDRHCAQMLTAPQTLADAASDVTAAVQQLVTAYYAVRPPAAPPLERGVTGAPMGARPRARQRTPR